MDLPSSDSRLRRSLNGRERAFSFAKGSRRKGEIEASGGITTRLLLVKAPNNEGLHK